MDKILQGIVQRQQNLNPEDIKTLKKINEAFKPTTLSTWIEAPRTWQMKKKLIDVAPSWGVELKFTDHDRRFFRETIYFDVTGQKRNVEAFLKSVSNSMERFNDGL